MVKGSQKIGPAMSLLNAAASLSNTGASWSNTAALRLRAANFHRRPPGPAQSRGDDASGQYCQAGRSEERHADRCPIVDENSPEGNDTGTCRHKEQAQITHEHRTDSVEIFRSVAANA